MVTPPITVAIVDDHALFRDGLANLLSESSELAILFKAKDGADMQQQIITYGIPNVVLMDVNMPVMNGAESTKWLKENHTLVHVLALSMLEDEINIIKMIKCGAGGYLMKNSSTAEVIKSIQAVVQTGYCLNEHITGSLIRSIQSDEQPKDQPNLTRREIEFLQLCCSEWTYKEIADRMSISVKTVNNYREALFEKLNCKSRVGLVLYAIKHHIVILN